MKYIAVGLVSLSVNALEVPKNITIDDGDYTIYHFDSQESVDAVYIDNFHTGTIKAMWDPVIGGGKLTIEPHVSDDTAGMFWIHFPYTDTQLWLRYKVRVSESFVNEPNISKMAIIYHNRSCSEEALVQLIRPANVEGIRPSFYEKCGGAGYVIYDPLSQGYNWEYQPGGDTSCLRHGEHPTLPCWKMPGNTWVTFTINIDFEERETNVWAQAEGEPKYHIIDYPTQSITRASTVQLGPYMNDRDTTIDYPKHEWWYQDIEYSTMELK